LEAEGPRRPLLAGDAVEKLAGLLRTRADHYASFPARVDTDGLSPEEAAWQTQVQVGRFRVEGMGEGYDVLVLPEKLETAGSRLRGTDLEGPVALVSDENVAGCYAERVMNSLRQADIECRPVILSAGEGSKNVRSLSRLWGAFVNARLDRKSTVLALGGGVVTDLAGFAAATYLRGIAWAAVPTSLLGMTDASLGGKTGIDLEQGKNLAGAFHAPSLVLAYPQVLASLPEVELRNGLAEVVKAGLIGDARLFEECAQGWDALISQPMEGEAWTHLVSQAVAVKVRILREDPYEQGRRAVLNLGHTLGHAIEQASGYSLRHGEAVSIGLAIEARVGEALGVTQSGLSSRIGQVLTGLGLPVRIPAGVDPEVIQRSLGMDKKRRRDRIRLPLPVRVGQAIEGFEIEEEKLWQLYWSCMDRT
jgi:3-dehydroquinate synthase